MHKISVSLPEDVVLDLNFISRRLGFSRSALLAEMVATPLEIMKAVIEEDEIGEETYARKSARGSSKEQIKQLIQDTIDGIQG